MTESERAMENALEGQDFVLDAEESRGVLEERARIHTGMTLGDFEADGSSVVNSSGGSYMTVLAGPDRRK